jgi:hypothetical protein
MHLNHDPIPTVPPRGILDYTHPSGEVFDPLNFDGSSRTDGSTAVFCLGRENEVRLSHSAAFYRKFLNHFSTNQNCSAGNTVFQNSIFGKSHIIWLLAIANVIHCLDHLGPYLTVNIGSFACSL